MPCETPDNGVWGSVKFQVLGLLKVRGRPVPMGMGPPARRAWDHPTVRWAYRGGPQSWLRMYRKVDVRLAEKGNSFAHGARMVHVILIQ